MNTVNENNMYMVFLLIEETNVFTQAGHGAPVIAEKQVNNVLITGSFSAKENVREFVVNNSISVTPNSESFSKLHVQRKILSLQII